MEVSGERVNAGAVAAIAVFTVRIVVSWLLCGGCRLRAAGSACGCRSSPSSAFGITRAGSCTLPCKPAPRAIIPAMVFSAL